jgi:tryptophanyl-tRNA synthetase
LATFKQYREADGKFYFKLVEGERVLLQSHAFDAPRDAGQAIAALRRGACAVADAPAALGDGVTEADVRAAIEALALADTEKAKARETTQ